MRHRSGWPAYWLRRMVASRRRRAISPSHALGSGKRGLEKSGAHWNQVGIRPRGSLRETQGDVVIGRVREVLPRAQISLCGPHARMTEEQLDLLQFAGQLRGTVSPRCAAGREARSLQTSLRGVVVEDLPDYLFGETVAPDAASVVDRQPDVA